MYFVYLVHTHDHEYRPPLGLQVLLLVALRELTHGQVGVQPVHLRGLEVLEEEAVAPAVFDARPHAAAGQHHVDDVLGGVRRGAEAACTCDNLTTGSAAGCAFRVHHRQKQQD